jgi:hypothetical protein
MSAEPRTVNLALDTHGVRESSARPLISAPKITRESAVLAHFTVPAFGVFVGSVH